MGSSKSDVSKLLKLMNDSVLNKSSLEDFVAEVLESFDLKLKESKLDKPPAVILEAGPKSPVKGSDLLKNSDLFNNDNVSHYDLVLNQLRAERLVREADLEADKNKELFLPFKDPDQKILDKMHKIMKTPHTTLQNLIEKRNKEAQEEVRRKQLQAKENFDKGKGAFMKKRKWSEMWNMPETDFLKLLQEKSSLLSAKEQDLLNSKENAELKQDFIVNLLNGEQAKPITESEEKLDDNSVYGVEVVGALKDALEKAESQVNELDSMKEKILKSKENFENKRGAFIKSSGAESEDLSQEQYLDFFNASDDYALPKTDLFVSLIEENNKPIKQLVNSAKLQHTPSEADINNAASIAKDVIKTIKSVKSKSNSKAKKKTPASKRKSK